MNPQIILAAINGALSLSASLLPIIAQYRNEGRITVEEQAELLAKYNSLKTQADGQFAGPAWRPSDKTP